MDSLKWPLRKLDDTQQRFKPSAFLAAVFKKYADDDGGKKAALITYYGFLSLFPLLLVVTAAIHLLPDQYTSLKDTILQGINEYFPVIGGQLQASIQGFHQSGLALIVGILLTIYGARGGAAAIRDAFNEIWDVPKAERPGFPKSIFHSLLMIFVGGGGLVVAAILSSYAAGISDSFFVQTMSLAVSFLILVGVFYMVFSLAIHSREPSRKDLLISAVAAAIGIQALQLLGGYLVTHQLDNLSSLYGTFAVVLGLLFWLYLQVQCLLLACFAGAVHSKHLWPRKIL